MIEPEDQLETFYINEGDEWNLSILSSWFSYSGGTFTAKVYVDELEDEMIWQQFGADQLLMHLLRQPSGVDAVTVSRGEEGGWTVREASQDLDIGDAM